MTLDVRWWQTRVPWKNPCGCVLVTDGQGRKWLFKCWSRRSDTHRPPGKKRLRSIKQFVKDNEEMLERDMLRRGATMGCVYYLCPEESS